MAAMKQKYVVLKPSQFDDHETIMLLERVPAYNRGYPFQPTDRTTRLRRAGEGRHPNPMTQTEEQQFRFKTRTTYQYPQVRQNTCKMENKFSMVAKTFQGLEDVLRDELISLGAEKRGDGTPHGQLRGGDL